MVWFNLVYSLAEIGAVLQGILADPKWIAVAVAVQGIANVILRVWFTNTGLTFARDSER